MRAVNSATAAAIVGLDAKAFDNMIGRIGLSELPRGRQGLARRIPVSVLPQLLLTAELTERLGIPYKQAYDIARALAEGQQPAAPLVTMQADYERIRGQVNAQLEHVIESVVPRPRGRPRKS